MKKLAITFLMMGALFTGAFAQTTQNAKKTSTASTTHVAPKTTVKTKDEVKKTTPATAQTKVAVIHKHKHKKHAAKKATTTK